MKKYLNEYILFFILPVFELGRAVIHYRAPWAKNIVWLFVSFFGFTLIGYSQSMDQYAYAAQLNHFHSIAISFSEFVSTLYKVNGPQPPDLFEPFLMYLVSRFTGDSRIFFAIVGIVFGYFYSRNIWIIIEQTNNKLKRIVLPFFFSLFFVIPIWEINGVRFFTAAQVFLYGILSYLIYKNKKHLIFVFLAGFFHFSFFAVVPIVIVYIIFANRTTLYFIFFLVSFGFSQINFKLFQQFINYLPSAFQLKSMFYLSEHRALEIAEIAKERSLLNIITLGSIRYIILILTVLIYFTYRKKSIKKFCCTNLFHFALLFLGTFNILEFIPSLPRFVAIGNFIIIGFFIIHFQNFYVNSKFKFVVNLTLPFVYLYIIGKIYIGTQYFGIFTFTNPLIAMWGPGNAALFKYIGF